MKTLTFLGAGLLLALQAHAATGQPFGIDTYLALQRVAELDISPDGAYVAYTLSSNDLEQDATRSAVWVQPTAGGAPFRVTEGGSSSWSPAWSPDNRYLAILSDRKDGTAQVWLLDRRGGDAQQLTRFVQGIRSYAWSPDGSEVALVAMDPSPSDLDQQARPNPRPHVIDRLQFKRDYVGYLDGRRAHVYVIGLAGREVRQLTSGDFDDGAPAWSPDGRQIVFVSNRTDTPDRNRNTDLWRVDTRRDGAQPERLTSAPYADGNPVYSPDGRYIAYTSNISEGLPIYAIPQLAILDLGSGRSQRVDSLAEIQVLAHRFAADGTGIFAVTEYRGEQRLVRVALESGASSTLIGGEDVVRAFDLAGDDRVVAIVSRPQAPAEIFSLAGGTLRPLSGINRELMAGVATGTVEKHTIRVEDGTDIDTFIVFPPGFEQGQRYPAVLHIHGGPWGQWDYRFDSESQLFAAQGYVVIMPNPRGSFGYGQAFTDALTGDWGGIDYGDLMAAVDFAIGKGWVDPDRMAVYGWSYGGFMTNHVITKTDRFKAAISGAGETLVMANYGHDEWQRLWEEEFGLPWLAGNRQAYDHISPFWALDRVTTPTLIVGGEDDWNMPILNSEQLFIVLRRRGIPTELVVYPGEHHSLSVPSYEKDLYERYLDWLARYVTEQPGER